MIFYVVTDTFEKYSSGDRVRQKLVLEQAARDLCLVLHYKQVTPRIVRELRPWAICHSGSGTPFEDYDVRQTKGYRQVVWQGRVPQLGICGGHQLMAEFFGSTVAPMRRIQPVDPDLNPKYHPGEFKEWGMYPVRIVQRDPLFRGCGAVVRVQQFHRSEVKELGPELTLLASSADCAVQAFAHRRKPLYGVQFHPEEATEVYADGFKVLRNFFRVAREWRKRDHRTTGPQDHMTYGNSGHAAPRSCSHVVLWSCGHERRARR